MQEAVRRTEVQKEPKHEPIVIHSEQFGKIVVQPSHIFHFPQGIIGFENLEHYVIISLEATYPFKWLLSVENPSLRFPIINTLLINPNYSLHQKYNPNNYLIFAIVCFSSEKKITANLRSPIILDIAKQEGKQIILTSEEFPIEFVIFEAK